MPDTSADVQGYSSMNGLWMECFGSNNVVEPRMGVPHWRISNSIFVPSAWDAGLIWAVLGGCWSLVWLILWTSVEWIDIREITHIHLHEIQSEPINTQKPLPEIISHLNFLRDISLEHFKNLGLLVSIQVRLISSPFRQSRWAVEGFEIGRYGFMYKLGRQIMDGYWGSFRVWGGGFRCLFWSWKGPFNKQHQTSHWTLQHHLRKGQEK